MPTKYFLALTRDAEIRKAARTIRNKKNSEYYQRVLYIDNENDLRYIRKNIKNFDVIEVHGHGTPVVVGNEALTVVRTAPELASALLPAIPTDKKIFIDLRTCNSATIQAQKNGTKETTLCFARDLSLFLSGIVDHTAKIIVTGYIGFIRSERTFKQSLVAEYSRQGAKVKHCKLEDGLVQYRSGNLIKDAKIKLIDMMHDCDSESDPEVEELIRQIEKLSLILNSQNSLAQSPKISAAGAAASISNEEIVAGTYDSDNNETSFAAASSGVSDENLVCAFPVSSGFYAPLFSSLYDSDGDNSDDAPDSLQSSVKTYSDINETDASHGPYVKPSASIL